MLPRNMGPVHRASYFVIGTATVAFALFAAPPGLLARLGLGTLGLITVASSISGY